MTKNLLKKLQKNLDMPKNTYPKKANTRLESVDLLMDFLEGAQMDYPMPTVSGLPKRKLNYKYFTEQEWGKMSNYHLSIDSGKLGIEKAVDIIISAVGGTHE